MDEIIRINKINSFIERNKEKLYNVYIDVDKLKIIDVRS